MFENWECVNPFLKNIFKRNDIVCLVVVVAVAIVDDVAFVVALKQGSWKPKTNTPKLSSLANQIIKSFLPLVDGLWWSLEMVSPNVGHHMQSHADRNFFFLHRRFSTKLPNSMLRWMSFDVIYDGPTNYRPFISYNVMGLAGYRRIFCKELLLSVWILLVPESSKYHQLTRSCLANCLI